MPLALAGTVLTGAYMGRALRVLWHGDPGTKPGAVPAMAAGMAALVALAVVLGAAFGPLERLLGADMAEAGLAAPILGLAAAFSGLVLGWLVPVAQLLRGLLPWAQRGFVMAGGIDGVIVRPALAIAASCERLEQWLYDAALAAGRATLSLGQSADRADNDGIDAAIFGLVDRTIALGARARRLQSGFIHRELAITTIGIAIIIVALVAAPYLV